MERLGQIEFGAGDDAGVVAEEKAAQSFLSLIGAAGKPLTFWIYAAFGVLAFAFTWVLVPETRGKRLEQIEAYWERGRTWPDQPRPTQPEPRRSA